MTRAGHRLDLAIVLAGALVALLTLLPQGGGVAWGAPLEELRWYASGLSSEATLLQLIGNLAVLGPLAVLAVLRWPALASPLRVGSAALAVAVGIEVLQWVLPLGRVVSPLDAVLNTAGALLAGGAAVAMVRSPRAPAP